MSDYGSTCAACDECRCDNCCAGIAVATPVSVANRPGLPQLRYRVGTHPQFLASMRARLASADFPALHAERGQPEPALTTRDPADFSMALLDGWATVADVLTFYTERIANEGFLRTATEEFSVRRLAELVGYRPRPGLSASAYLGFTVTAGQTVPIPVGTRAQQVPGPGQLPATFETAEPLLAHGNLSVLPMRRKQPPLLIKETLRDLTRPAFDGNVTEMRPGDRILVKLNPRQSGGIWAIYEVTAIEFDPPANRTTATVVLREDDLPIGPRRPPRTLQLDAEVHDPLPKTRLELLVAALRKPASQPPGNGTDLNRDLRDLLGADKGGVTALLGGIVPEVAGVLDTALAHSSAANPHPPVITRMGQRAMLFGATAPKFPKYVNGSVTGYIDPMLTPLKDHVDGVGSVAASEMPEDHDNIKPPYYIPGKTVDLDGVYSDIVADSEVVFLNPTLPESEVEFRNVVAVETVTVRILGLSMKVTRLTLDLTWPSMPPAGEHGPDDPPLRKVLANTVVLAQPQNLSLAGDSLDDVDVGCVPPGLVIQRSDTPPPDAGSPGSTCGDTLELDGLFPELAPGRWLVVSGERTDAEIRAAQQPGDSGPGATGVRGGELVMVAAVEHRVTRIKTRSQPGGEAALLPKIIDLPGDTVHTFVRLAAPLAFTYLRPSVVVYGNVVPATHGETRREVLGSGDPSKQFARYPLKQPPLTYLPAPTAAGARATLDVFVDSVRWHEADSLLDIGPDDRRYVIDTDDDGNSAVVFGAARPPSGAENIKAQYRSGIGKSGNTATGTVTTPLDQPLGVTAVTNPLPATGGANRDGRETVRRNAAVSVQALDRLVSVSDYADFATGFAGVGAATAKELSDGRRLVVHVTIAGIDDAPIAATSDLTTNLRRALLELGDPNQEVQVAVRILKALTVSARVRIDPDRTWVDVEPAVRARLLATFGPGQREIGQGVAESEVLAAMQSVPGVIYTDLTILDSLSEDELVSPNPTAKLDPKEQPRTLVRAELASFDTTAPPGVGAIRPAELLIISPPAPDTLVLEAL